MKKSPSDRPFAIDIALPLLQQLTSAQQRLQQRSVSALIRQALAEFDIDSYEPDHVPHMQISVRLPADQRKALRKAAKARKVSVGELVRVAVEGFLTEHAQPKTPAAKAGAAPVKRGAR